MAATAAIGAIVGQRLWASWLLLVAQIRSLLTSNTSRGRTGVLRVDVFDLDPRAGIRADDPDVCAKLLRESLNDTGSQPGRCAARILDQPNRFNLELS